MVTNVGTAPPDEKVDPRWQRSRILDAIELDPPHVGADRVAPAAAYGPGRIAMYAGLAVVAVVLLYVLISGLVGWVRVTMDDLAYGRPRTTHMEAYVGHAGEAAGVPSHFVAMNLDRRVVVIELPGGNTAGATTISGPYLFGSGEELTPVHLSTQDVDGDGAPDLILGVGDEQLVYINQPAQNSFRLITSAERAALLNSSARGGSLPAQDGTSR